jgi:uncharacterized protein YcfJ
LNTNLSLKQVLTLLPLTALGAFSSQTANAYEQARVISSTPIVQQVNAPQRICQNVTVAVPEPKTGAGAALGAIAGGVVGNAVGQGAGNAAATALGIMGGAILGDKMEGSSTALQNTQQCSTEYTTQSRITQFNVVYEYAGKQYNVIMPSDPGPTLTIQLSPAVGNSSTVVAPEGTVSTQQVYTQPVYVSQPVYVNAYPNAYPYAYPGYGYPLAVGIGLGYYWRGGYNGGYHGGRWR